MRHLGTAIKFAMQHHVKMLLVTEVLSRTAKNIYNEIISENILAFGNGKEKLSANIEDWCLMSTVDFLNLLLGNSKESN